MDILIWFLFIVPLILYSIIVIVMFLAFHLLKSLIFALELDPSQSHWFLLITTIALFRQSVQQYYNFHRKWAKKTRNFLAKKKNHIRRGILSTWQPPISNPDLTLVRPSGALWPQGHPQRAILGEKEKPVTCGPPFKNRVDFRRLEHSTILPFWCKKKIRNKMLPKWHKIYMYNI